MSKTSQVAKVASHNEVATTVKVAKLSSGKKSTIEVELRGAATRNPWWELFSLGMTLGELAEHSEREMLKLRSVGPYAVRQVADLFKQAGVAWVGNDRQVAADRQAELAAIVRTALAGLTRLGATADERELVVKAIQDNTPLDGEEGESDLAKLIKRNIAALEDDDDDY